MFNIVQPTTAYFGQKDAAQCVLIKRIVEDLNIPVEIKVKDTIRESDGLAMSSRNAYLMPDERKIAPIVHASLIAAKSLYQSEMKVSFEGVQTNILVEEVKKILKSEPRVSEIQYVSIDSKETMQPLEMVGLDGAVISLACKIGNVRLIDNILLP